MSATVRKHSQMSEIGPEAHTEVREWSRGPPVCPEVVARPSRISVSGQEALPDV